MPPMSADSRGRMAVAIARVGRQIAAAKRFIGADVRLVVLPEYLLTGFPMGDSAAGWADKAAIDVGGDEYAALGAVARAADIHLAGNAYERDVHFPGLYFQTSFLIDPAGAVVLRYRRLISLFGPSPYDVWDRYVEVHGPAAIFPVADTAIGRIAAIASEEILYPDIARAFALRGAELLVHSSSEVARPCPRRRTSPNRRARSRISPTWCRPTPPGSRAFAIGPFTDHSVESVGQSHNAHSLRHFVPTQTVGIPRSVAAFVMPTHNFRNLRPRELHMTHDLMTHDCVVPHLAVLFGIEP